MSDAPTVKPDQAAAKAAARGSQSNPEREVEPAEVRYTVEELTENPRLLGSRISPHGIAGVLSGESQKTWTLSQAAKKLDEALTRPLDNQPAELEA
jgi:hypothetical protein